MISRSISGMHDAMNTEMSMPFEKGKNDCLSFCMSALSGLGLKIGKYRRYGGKIPSDSLKEFEEFCIRRKWIKIEPQKADTGSFGLLEVMGQYCPGVFVGGAFIARTENGILSVQQSSCISCYRTVI